LAAVGLMIFNSDPALAQKNKKPVQSVDLTPASPDDILPPDFRGSITYRGFYKGKASAPTKMETSWGRGLERALGVKMYPMAGDYDITIEFNGNRISGNLRTTNNLQGESMALSPARFIGTREGAVCHMQWSDGDETTDYCGKSLYRNVTDVWNAQGSKVQFSVTAPAAELVDFVERDRTNAIETARREAAAKAEHAAAMAARAKLRASLPRGASAHYTPMLDQAVLTDSQTWAFNVYRPRSIDLVAAKYDKQYNATYLKAYFSYANGNEGWVGAIVQNQEILCLQFWDDPSGCRAIGQGIGGRMTSALIAGMLSSGNGRSPSASEQYDTYEQQCRQQGKEPGNC
jgi:hypothetical protein